MSIRAELVAELEAVRARISDVDTTNLTPEAAEALDADLTRAEALEADIVRADERAKKVTETLSRSVPSEVAPSGPTFIKRTSDADVYDIERMDVRHDAREFIARAATAVEKAPVFVDDSGRENVTRFLDDGRADIARYVLETGSPEYADEFQEYLRSKGRVMGPRLQRAAMSLTTANGGAMVPYVLDPSVILTNNGATNPIRGLARVETITGATEWRGVTSAGVTAEWLAEGTEAADATPTFAQPAIPTFKAAAYLFGSYEVLADSGFGSQVSGLIADAFDRLEATAFATGGGTTAPEGVVTGVSAVTASRVSATTNNSFGAVDVYALAAALPPRYRANSAWAAEQSILHRIRQFDTSGGSSFWANLGVATPEQLLGRPVAESSAMDGTIGTGDDDVLLIGDFRQGYVIVDRVGVEIMYDNMVLGSNRRPTGQAGFFAFKRTGAEVVDANAFRLLRV
jgi:HK97 family phage major capsid protein